VAQGPIDIKKPGAPAGIGSEMWPLKEMPWKDLPNPWPGDPNSANGGGRMSVPPGGSSGPVTNTDVPI
jgi:hypothetical protein